LRRVAELTKEAVTEVKKRWQKVKSEKLAKYIMQHNRDVVARRNSYFAGPN